MASTSSSTQTLPHSGRSQSIGEKRNHAFAAAVSEKYPARAETDAERARAMSVWRRIWSFAAAGDCDRIRGLLSEITNAGDLQAAQDILERVEARTPPAKTSHVVAAHAKHNVAGPSSTLLQKVSVRVPKPKGRSTQAQIANMLVSLLNQRVFGTKEDAWREFEQIGYVDQGVILMTLVSLNEGRHSHPGIQAFLQLVGWDRESGLGVGLAIELYRKRLKTQNRRGGP